MTELLSVVGGRHPLYQRFSVVEFPSLNSLEMYEFLGQFKNLSEWDKLFYITIAGGVLRVFEYMNEVLLFHFFIRTNFFIENVFPC